MKVYFLGSKYEGCYYVRCMLPLRHNGWDGDYLTLHGSRKDPQTATRAMLDADIIVAQRPYESVMFDVYSALKEAGKKIVFDNDDTYKVNDVMKLGKYLDKISNNIDQFIGMSDMITTTTEFLAEEYRKLNKNVVVIPNQIDPDDYETPLRNRTDRIRVGVVGSVGATKDFEGIRDTLKELSADPRYQLVLFSLPPKQSAIADKYNSEFSFWDSLNIEWHPFVNMRDYFKTLNSLRLDMMVIPREDSYFNRAKSNLKFLEASMFEIPVIAQGFKDGLSPYQFGDDPKYMEIVTENDWMDRIKKLSDKELRREMGKAAKKYVLKNYNIEKNYKLWKQAYAKLY